MTSSTLTCPRLAIMSAIPGELEFLRTRLGGRDVVLAESGIGKVNAAISTTLLITEHQPSTILFTGVAGGLDPDLSVGDVVIAEQTIQHDAGVIAGERIVTHQAGHVPFFNPSVRLGYQPSPALLAAAHSAVDGLELAPLTGAAGDNERPPRIIFGTILTGDQFLNCATTRVRLHDEFEGTAIEMEGAAVAQTAERFGVDCLVVRAVSDLAGAESDIDFMAFLDQVAANSATVVEAIIDELGPTQD